MGGPQNRQVFYLNFILEVQTDLSLSEKKRGMFPSEIHKALYARRVTLKDLQKYYVTFKAPFHLFF